MIFVEVNAPFDIKVFLNFSSNMMIYKVSSLDQLAKIVTMIISALFVGIFVFQWFHVEEFGLLAVVLTQFFLVATYFFAYFLRPTELMLHERVFIINRLLFPVKIDFSQIVSVRQIGREDISGSLRLFGVGGLFGYFGIFTNLKFGKMTWYVTNRNQVLLIQTKEKKIIISAEDPALLTTDFEKFLRVNE